MSYTMSKGRGNCPGGENVRGKMSGSPQRSEVDVFIQSVWDNSVVGVPVTVGGPLLVYYVCLPIASTDDVVPCSPSSRPCTSDSH